MVEISGYYRNSCDSKLHTMKIEADKSLKLKFDISDSVDSLNKTKFIELLKQINPKPLFYYLEMHNLESATFLKNLSLTYKTSKCQTTSYPESQVKNYLIFNGIQYTVFGVWMKPEHLTVGPPYH